MTYTLYSTINDLRSAPTPITPNTPIIPRDVAIVANGTAIGDSNGAVYWWNKNELLVDDGVRVIKPSATLATDQGRWVLTNTMRLLAERFGVVANDPNFAASNTTKINEMESMLSAFANQDGVWRTVIFPEGNIYHNATLVKKNSVNWIGQGRDATRFVYTGTTGTALEIKGTSDADRRKVRIAEMSISGTAGNTAVGIETAYVIRAFECLDNVTIIGFGGHGLLIGDNCFDSTFKGLEILACGTAASLNAAGVARKTTAPAIAAITFQDLKIEACGAVTPVGTAGGILWGSSPTNKTGGLWFTGLLRIQNNRGVAQCFIANVDALGFQDVYVESDLGTTSAKTGLSFEDCRVAISGMTRFGGNESNLTAFKLNTQIISSVNYPSELYLASAPVVSTSNWTNDFTLNGPASGGSFVIAPPANNGLPYRISKDANSDVLVNGRTHGVFDGLASVPGFVSGTNYAVSRIGAGAGQYLVTFKKPMPNANYTVVGNAQKSDNSAFYSFGYFNRTTTSVSIAVATAAGALTNANRVSFEIMQA
jgi:hypothetical protein